MQPTIGRIVHYTLTSIDAEEINRRRSDARAFATNVATDKLLLGIESEAGGWAREGRIVHTGNDATEGQVYPAVIVRVFNPDLDPCPVNLQVILDGNDTFWATSRCEGHGFGHWAWPTRD